MQQGYLSSKNTPTVSKDPSTPAPLIPKVKYSYALITRVREYRST